MDEPGEKSNEFLTNDDDNFDTDDDEIDEHNNTGQRLALKHDITSEVFQLPYDINSLIHNTSVDGISVVDVSHQRLCYENQQDSQKMESIIGTSGFQTKSLLPSNTTEYYKQIQQHGFSPSSSGTTHTDDMPTVDKTSNDIIKKNKDATQSMITGDKTETKIDEENDYLKTIKWTSNEIINKLQAGDVTNFCGYIAEIFGETETTNGQQVMLVILKNNNNKEIQLAAWNDNIPKLKAVTELGNIIKAKRLTVHDERYKSQYNHAKNNKSLRLQFSSSVSVIGYRDVNLQAPQTITDTDFSNICNNEGLIRVRGFLKNEIRRNTLHNVMCGSITDGEFVIQFNIVNNKITKIIEKGTEVLITGIVDRRTNYKIHHIELATEDNIEILDTPRMKHMELFACYKHI